ncbi:hypothetical protein [Paenirhodobacter enshiensis]|uniref:Pentapeptide MXKDX repeat protein n=1 Tax=Paenirhodobacter enshiensis TaxID=1105367 RepID=A0A086XS41_9RHOB|nr:hypothetical protein [Paenirhodobacter enshiensis]KFI24841.1 hypothetical protein CG50_07540 [Paenirhodobacter enshiensis]
MKSVLALLALTTAVVTSVAGALTAAPMPSDAQRMAATADAEPLRLADAKGEGHDSGRHDDSHDGSHDSGHDGAHGSDHGSQSAGSEDHDDDAAPEADDDTASHPDTAMPGTPAPSAAPTGNGLFTPGTKPVVQMN